MDGNVVPCELESMVQVWDAVVADAHQAPQGHQCPALNRASGKDCKANGVYDVCCRSPVDKHTLSG